LKGDLRPIVCIGETLTEREAGNTLAVLETEVRNGLKGLSVAQASNLIIAYEPMWAIGTGKTATPEIAQEAHAHIRKILAAQFGAEASEKIIIQYGGSVKPDNIDALMAQKDIDGALVGGASLDGASFERIVKFRG
jgi:triosephosphate isomerase